MISETGLLQFSSAYFHTINMKNKIIPKPWGQEEVIEINDKYMVKKLTMHAGHRCSLQYHNHKRETIYVLSGRLKIIYGRLASR